MYDLLAVSYAIDIKLFKTIEVNVSCEIKDKIRYGKTFIRKGLKHNCLLVENVEAEKIEEIFFKILNKNNI